MPGHPVPSHLLGSVPSVRAALADTPSSTEEDPLAAAGGGTVEEAGGRDRPGGQSGLWQQKWTPAGTSVHQV